MINEENQSIKFNILLFGVNGIFIGSMFVCIYNFINNYNIRFREIQKKFQKLEIFLYQELNNQEKYNELEINNHKQSVSNNFLSFKKILIDFSNKIKLIERNQKLCFNIVPHLNELINTIDFFIKEHEEHNKYILSIIPLLNEIKLKIST
jgi:hypothetical protein